MTSSKSNPSVESIITQSAEAANDEIVKNDDRFYMGLTGLALVGLVTLLVLALS